MGGRRDGERTMAGHNPFEQKFGVDFSTCGTADGKGAEYYAKEACGYVETLIEFYQRKKEPKRDMAIFCRNAALVFGGIGSIFAVSSFDLNNIFGYTIASKDLGYPSFTLAAVFIAIDKVTACSSSWMRFIRAQTDLQMRLNQFKLDWLDLCAQARAAAKPLEDPPALAVIRQFVIDADALISKETDAWISEWRDGLAQLEKNYTKTASGKVGTAP
jgi:hypothetical protein